MDEELTESLWVRIKGKAEIHDITVGICYRPPHQYRQIGVTSHSQALFLMRDFNHIDICWRGNTEGHKHSRRFLECIGNFLLQVTEEPMLDLVPANKEGLMGDVKLKGSLGCSNRGKVDLEILRAGRRAHSKLTALDFRREDFGLFRVCLAGCCGIEPWRDEGPRRAGLVFKNHLLEVMHPNKEEVGQKHQEVCIDEQGARG
ncbi:hypothetical protein BTVI_63815 [Pitangus sulphuratus]|nr:hypothetical protein BTVI_63815 [Pitangus sulphuratus]